MAITAPYSLELTQDESAKNAVAGTLVTAIVGKMKIFLGANVKVGHRQAYIGTLKAAFATLKSAKGSSVSTVRVISGKWDAGSSGNFLIDTVTTGVTVDDVAIVVASDFGFDKTHMSDETFKQLINVLLEKTKSN